MEPHWDPSLVCTLFIFCPWCPYYSQTAKVSQHQKDGGRRRGEIRSRPQWTLPQGRGLINNLHISKMQRIKSNMSCFFFFFLQNHRAPALNWEASHVQSEGSCLFFWNNLSFSLSLSQAHQLTASPSSPPPLLLPLPRSLAVITVCVNTAQSSGTLLLYTSACLYSVTQSTQLAGGGGRKKKKKKILQIWHQRY